MVKEPMVTGPKREKTRIIATRPEAQNADWCARLQQGGLECLAIPLLEIVAIEDARRQQAIRQQILTIDEYQKLIFVSQNAVDEAFRWIDQYWPQLPVG